MEILLGLFLIVPAILWLMFAYIAIKGIWFLLKGIFTGKI